MCRLRCVAGSLPDPEISPFRFHILSREYKVQLIVILEKCAMAKRSINKQVLSNYLRHADGHNKVRSLSQIYELCQAPPNKIV